MLPYTCHGSQKKEPAKKQLAEIRTKLSVLLVVRLPIPAHETHCSPDTGICSITVIWVLHTLKYFRCWLRAWTWSYSCLHYNWQYPFAVEGWGRCGWMDILTLNPVLLSRVGQSLLWTMEKPHWLWVFITASRMYRLLIIPEHFPCNQGKLWKISQGSWKTLFSDNPVDLGAFQMAASPDLLIFNYFQEGLRWLVRPQHQCLSSFWTTSSLHQVTFNETQSSDHYIEI